MSISLTHSTSGVTQEPPQGSFIWLFGAPEIPVSNENSESMQKSSDLSCPGRSVTGMLAFISSFFHGSLVGFAAARNWNSRSLRSATSWQSYIASVLVAPSSSRSIAYSGSGSTGSGRGASVGGSRIAERYATPDQATWIKLMATPRRIQSQDQLIPQARFREE
jgi:hypothetical protein